MLKFFGHFSDTRDVAEFLSQRLIGRMAALLFMLSGVVTLANLAVPTEGRNLIGSLSVGILAVAIGVVCWYLPWQRWPRNATLGLVPVAFGLIAAGGYSSINPWSYGVYYVVAFVWIGAAQKPGTSAIFAPLGLVAYIAPILMTGQEARGITSVGVIIPVCILVGETLSWISSRLRQAERLDLRRMGDMEALLNAAVTLAEEEEAAGASNLVAELAVRLMRGQSAVVLLAEPGGVLRGAGGCNWQGRVQALEARWLDQPARAALTTGDLTTHKGGVSGALTKAGKGAPALFLPLMGVNGALGLVMVTFPSGTKLELDGFASGLARTFATQASLAFDRLQATQVLLDASMKDALTGVGNRRRADAIISAMKPGDAVIILDLDHFKAVNDQFGHATGDEVLISLARWLDQSLRDGDTIARYGGEEFVIVMRQAGPNALRAIQRLADGWRSTGPVTTYSAGVAVHQAEIDANATLAMADDALYRAKAAGRDRCVLAGEREPDLQSITA